MRTTRCTIPLFFRALAVINSRASLTTKGLYKSALEMEGAAVAADVWPPGEKRLPGPDALPSKLAVNKAEL